MTGVLENPRPDAFGFPRNDWVHTLRDLIQAHGGMNAAHDDGHAKASKVGRDLVRAIRLGGERCDPDQVRAPAADQPARQSLIPRQSPPEPQSIRRLQARVRPSTGSLGEARHSSLARGLTGRRSPRVHPCSPGSRLDDRVSAGRGRSPCPLCPKEPPPRSAGEPGCIDGRVPDSHGCAPRANRENPYRVAQRGFPVGHSGLFG